MTTNNNSPNATPDRPPAPDSKGPEELDPYDPVAVANWPDFNVPDWVPSEWPPSVPDPHAPASSWTPIDTAPVIEGLLDGTIEAPRHDVGPIQGGGYLLTSGAVSALFGGPASGKTWTALRVCADVLAEGRRAVYIDLEDRPESVLGRLIQMGAPAEELLLRFDYVAPSGMLTEDDRADLLQVIEAAAPAVVVIDSTGEALAGDGLDGNADGDVAHWMARLPRSIARLGPAVLLLDHATKATGQDKNARRFAIGSQRKLAGLDGAGYRQEMARPFSKGHPGHATLTATKDRQGAYHDGQAVAELHVTPAPGPDVAPGLAPLSVTLKAVAGADGEPRRFRPTGYMERVSRALEADGRPLSVRGIRDAVGGKKDRLTEALACLIEEGYVVTQDGPRGATLHTVAHPYREIEDPESDSHVTVAGPWPPSIKGGGHGPRSARTTGHGQGHGGPRSALRVDFPPIFQGKVTASRKGHGQGHGGPRSRTQKAPWPN